MLYKTHLMSAIFIILLFINNFNDQISFIVFVLISAIIPDIDTNCSNIGNHALFRPIQFFVRHRGILHTFTFALIIFGILYYYAYFAAIPFLIGYSLHLILDAFTKQGITPFWPFKLKVSGFLRTGGRIESLIFILLVTFSFILFAGKFLI